MMTNGKNLTCPWCKFHGNYKALEKHITGTHFISYRSACEISLLQGGDPDGKCYKCNSPKTPLTFLIPNYYYVPCWNCLSTRDRKAMIKTLVEEIEEFYSKILSDRYLQLFLIDPIYYEATIPHTYDTFKSVLGKKELPSRNDIWFIDWLRGTPKVISRDNLDGIEIKDLGELYNITSTRNKINLNSYSIEAPLIVKYDSIHHGRYNILNMKGDRKTKRLRIPGTDTCFKFWNNEGEGIEDWKSILRVTKQGSSDPEENVLGKMSPLDFLTLKLVLLRNKAFMKHIFQILSILLQQGIRTFADHVFLGNTIDICSMDEKRKYNLVLSWKPIPLNEQQEENTINISIL